MKVDVTTIFFNSIIPDATATAPWCVSIGQGKEKKINSSIDGLQDILDGLIYKAVKERSLVDLSAGSKNNEYLLISKFDKIFVNGSLIDNLQLIVTLVREHTKSHEGRLRISLPPYAKYDDGETIFSNESTYQAISDFLGCGNIYDGGCWFVDDISVVNQDEFHFSCVVVNQSERMSYRTSQVRSSEWQELVPENHAYTTTEYSESNNDVSLQQIFYGAPGTGKSFAIDNLTNDENTVRTTFHPDSDYASFVGAYKPTMEDVRINSIYGESVQYATGKNGHPGTEKKIVYKYVPQAFLKAYVAAWSDLDNPHYLVIEEINRGNCAQIFGDLFQLLDRNSYGSSSYAIHADDDIRQFISADSKGFGNLLEEQKQAIADFVLVKDNGKRSEIGPKILSGELLLLPPNLRIWATMNTSDQSLFPIDSAFKRRWNWHYVPIEYDKKDWLLHIGENYYRWGDFLRVINPIISELTESADKQMGYFFAKPDEKHGETTENNTISEDVFINKVLFYLWTDVLKDFDAGKEPFLNPDTKRAYEFSDFFDAKHDYLEQFVGKLRLDVVDINFDSITDDDSDVDEATSSDPSQRDHSRYSINGEGKYNKRQTVLRALRKYVEANPSMTSEGIIENWKNVNPDIPYFILSASDYESRIKEYPAQRDRYWSVKTGTEEKVYITNQWGAGRIAEFIRLINNSNFGLHIDKVTE